MDRWLADYKTVCRAAQSLMRPTFAILTPNPSRIFGRDDSIGRAMVKASSEFLAGVRKMMLEVAAFAPKQASNQKG